MPLDKDTVAVLAAWGKTQLEEPLAWGPAWTDSGRVFTREDGTPIRPNWVSVRFYDLAAQAGLPPIRFRDPRHGSATIAARDRHPARAGYRSRVARVAIPSGTNEWAGWDAARLACARADEMASQQYDQILGRLDDLAAELLASQAYQQTRSAAARKRTAEQFLISPADGFAPPVDVRDELQRLNASSRPPKGARAACSSRPMAAPPSVSPCPQALQARGRN